MALESKLKQFQMNEYLKKRVTEKKIHILILKIISYFETLYIAYQLSYIQLQ